MRNPFSKENKIFKEITEWLQAYYFYFLRQARIVYFLFEKYKGYLVSFLMAKRGRYSRPFLNLSLVVLVATGIIAGPVIAESYPGIEKGLADFAPPSSLSSSLEYEELSTSTYVSEKPRDQVIVYKVQQGETLSSVAKKFGISIDTIKWANDLKGEKLSLNQEIKIPPVSGVVHRVHQGENIYSLAQKYKTDPQKIVNFPFNDFADMESFGLRVGQTLIIPDGVMPEAPAIAVRPLIPAAGLPGKGGKLAWPAGGSITQYPVWYHMAIDIANNAAPDILAAEKGQVIYAECQKYAYGCHVILDHGEGLQTLYAHLSKIYVNVGDVVGRGGTVGKMGSTGRSTGIHLHFEVREGGRSVNPLPYLQ